MPLKVAIVGAGLIGCYVGGQLAACGHQVIFLGRERIARAIETHGLEVSNVANAVHKVARENYTYTTRVEDLLSQSDIDVVILTVKCSDTYSSALSLVGLSESIPIVSFQNGVGNAEEIARALPRHQVIIGMVPFNVVMHSDSAHFHQATAGNCFLASVPAATAIHAALVSAGVNTILHADMSAVLHGKLIVNLNNAVNALSGLPLRRQMGTRLYRKCISLCQWEALAVLERKQIGALSFLPTPIWTLPYVLSLPDWLFGVLASAVLSIDDTAYSSMYEDLTLGRTTEIDYLQGYISRLGKEVGVKTPCCDKVIELVKAAESAKKGSPNMAAEALLEQLTAVSQTQEK